MDKTKVKPRLGTQMSFSNERGNKSSILLTDADETYGNRRNQLKKDFFKRDVEQLKDRVKDLETTLALNKEIISEMIQGNQAGLNKKVFEKLSQENATLQAQAQKAFEERNLAQSKLLISSQIIEDLQRKEVECQKDREEHERELLDQLTRKEFMLQARERRCQTLKAIVVKYARKDPELDQALRELHIQMSEQQAHHVLKTEEGEAAMHRDHERASRLDKQVRDLLKANQEQAALINEMKLRKVPAVMHHQKPLSILPQYQRQDHSKIIIREAASPVKSLADIAFQQELEDKAKAAAVRLSALERENLVLKQRQAQVEAERDSLFALNSKLSAALKELQRKMDNLQQKCRIMKGSCTPLNDQCAGDCCSFSKQAGDNTRKHKVSPNKSMIMSLTSNCTYLSKLVRKKTPAFSIDTKEETREEDATKEPDHDKSEDPQKKMAKRLESSFGELSSIRSKSEEHESTQAKAAGTPILQLLLQDNGH